jgi:putative acetyltransferase
LIWAVLTEHGLQPDPDGTDADLADLEGSYSRRGGWFDVLVTSKDEIIATVALHPESAGVVELRKMYLRADHRGCGLGRFLFAHALALARGMGARRVTLETASALQAAIRLYERNGFRRLADGAACSCRCDIVMRLDLPEEPAPA